jgi:branched-chain amino acid transport system substrate-binding protein
MPIKKIYVVVIAAILIVAVVIAAYFVIPKAPTGAPPIKIGAIHPFTGPAARTGENFKDAVLLAIEDATKEGILPLEVDGVKRNVTIFWIDSESDPEKALKAYTEAIVKEKCDVMFGIWHSSVAMALQEVSTKYGIIHFGSLGESQYGCYAREKNPNASRYFFKMWPCPPKYEGLVGIAYKDIIDKGLWKPRNNKFAVLVEDTDYGRGVGEAARDSIIESIGFECVSFDVFSLSPPETEFYPLLTKYKNLDVSLVFFAATGLPSSVAFMKQQKEVGLNALINSHGISWFSLEDWYPAVGSEGSNYITCMDTPAVVTTEQKEFVDRFKNKYGFSPSIAAAGIQGYDGMLMLLKAIKTAKTLNAEVLRETILSTVYKGVWSTYEFARESCPEAHYMEVKVGRDRFFAPMRQWINGTDYVVWPTELATKPFEVPPT